MPVRPILLLPFDPNGKKIGGIRAFAEGFVVHAPQDVEPLIVGATESDDLPVGRWATINLGSREVPFLPVMRAGGALDARLPISARFASRLLRWRSSLPRESAVVQVHRPGTDLALLRQHLPSIRVIHNPSVDLAAPSSESKWRFAPRVLQRVEALSLERMDLVYAIGDEAAAKYRAQLPHIADRIKPITNWFDEVVFHPPTDAGERDRLRGDLGLEEAEVVLYVGRLERQKDPLLLAEAFARLAAVRPTARLMVLGDGALQRTVTDRLAGLGVGGSVRMEGLVTRERVSAVMRAADVLCVSSAAETGPTAGLEALGSGLPVVTTPVGMVARILRDRFPAGQVVSERSPAHLAAALEQVLDVPWDRRMRAAIASAGPFASGVVLAPIYDDHRRLVAERAAR